MLTFIVIIGIIIFILGIDSNSNKVENTKNKGIETNKKIKQPIKKRSSHSNNEACPINIIAGDFTPSDIIRFRGSDFKITNKNISENGNTVTLYLENLGDGKTVQRAFIITTDEYYLVNGVYVRKDNIENRNNFGKPKIDQTPKILDTKITGLDLVIGDNATCPRCQKRNNGYSKVCSSCAWKLRTPYVYRNVRLSGVTYENRQDLIARMSVYDKLSIRRDRKNRHDPNAIGIFNSQNQSIGWVPKDDAAGLAPIMDSGTEISVRALKKLGGNGYNWGLEVLISNDAEKLKGNPIVEEIKASPQKTSSYIARSGNYNRLSYMDDEDEDYRPSYIRYDDYNFDDYERDRDYDDFDEEAKGWEDLWEYNQNH